MSDCERAEALRLLEEMTALLRTAPRNEALLEKKARRLLNLLEKGR